MDMELPVNDSEYYTFTKKSTGGQIPKSQPIKLTLNHLERQDGQLEPNETKRKVGDFDDVLNPDNQCISFRLNDGKDC